MKLSLRKVSWDWKGISVQKKRVMTVVPEAPITLVYNAFVRKIQGQISAVPKSKQHLQPATPHSSFMLAKQVTDYSVKKDINPSFICHERRKKKRSKTRRGHLIILMWNWNFSKSCACPDQDSNLPVCLVSNAADFRLWAHKWIVLSYAMLMKYHSGMELPQHILVQFH